LKNWNLGTFSIDVILGDIDDSNIDLAVKTKNVVMRESGTQFSVNEGSNAKEVLYWPGLSISSPDRRSAIYSAAIAALQTADGCDAKKVGFFTVGFEVSRIPSWEVAEEILRAITNHSKSDSRISDIVLVASSPIQLSSFQFVLNNIATIVPE
jgi:hypothetical protein